MKTVYIDKYVVEQEVVERSSQAAVRFGFDSTQRNRVILKILGKDADEQESETFTRESFTLQHIPEHPHVIKLYDLTEDPDAIVLPMLQGKSLDKVLQSRQTLPAAECRDIVQGVLRGLGHIHENGIVHRDLKPANIMITPTPVVIDFGAAYHKDLVYLDLPDIIIGTPAYTSPEMAMCGRVDGVQQDFYSLGITLFEMCTGDIPYNSESSYGILKQHLTSRVPCPTDIDPSIPAELSDVVLRATARVANDRFQSADEMCRALDAVPDSRRSLFSSFKNFNFDNLYIGSSKTKERPTTELKCSELYRSEEQ